MTLTWPVVAAQASAFQTAFLPSVGVVRHGVWAVDGSPVVRLSQLNEHFGCAERAESGVGPIVTAVVTDPRDWSGNPSDFFLDAFAPDPADEAQPSPTWLGSLALFESLAG